MNVDIRRWRTQRGGKPASAPQPGRYGPGPAWLVVIDPQIIFGQPPSPWAAPRFADAMDTICSIAPRFGERVLVTRWVPTRPYVGSWRTYFKRWSFADLPADDQLFDLVPAAANLSLLPTIDVPTFSKWGAQLRTMLGPTPNLVLAGFSTDCCVLATALAAVDAGASVRVVGDACAASSEVIQTAALTILANYDPQIRVIDAAEIAG